MNVENRIRKMQGYAGNLLDGYRGLRQTFALLEPILPSTALSRKLGSGSSDEGFAVLQHVLFLSCALDVAKLCLDEGKKTPSIVCLIMALEADEIVKELRVNASRYVLPRKPHDDGNNEDELKAFEQAKQAERAAEFDERLRTLRRDWETFKNRPALAQFKRLRNKYIAHLEIRRQSNGEYAPIEVGGLGLKWNDVGEAAHAMEPLVLGLNMVIRSADFDMQGAATHFDKVRDDFWGSISRATLPTQE